MATRFPRPISVLLTITSMDGSLSMDPNRCIDCADAETRGARRANRRPNVPTPAGVNRMTRPLQTGDASSGLACTRNRVALISCPRLEPRRAPQI
jgi:hypothetical protein